MAAPKKLKNALYVTTVLEESQHEALRHIAYRKRKPMAELIRAAISKLIQEESVLERKEEANSPLKYAH